VARPPKGRAVAGARIEGKLDLESTNLRCPLCLHDCYLQQPVVLDYATVSRLELVHCSLADLSANLLIVSQDLNLRRSRIPGVVSLVDASVRGEFSCGATYIAGRDDEGNALTADRMTVGGNLDLVDCETRKGAVRFPGANISGRLDGHHAQMYGHNKRGNALMADRMSVSGSVLFDGGFKAGGAVRLIRARINGRLRFSGAQIRGCNIQGNSLAADEAWIGSDVLLDEGFSARGAVRFSQAQIEGSLSLKGAVLSGGSDTQCRKDATEGEDPIVLEGAKDVEDAAFVAEGAKIAQQLVWQPKEPVTGLVSLERTHLHHLDDHWEDDEAYWPRHGKLRLAGFTYDGFGSEQPAEVNPRLEWIRGQLQDDPAGRPSRFSAQPYEQLARVYRQSGQDADAREIAIAQRNDLRDHGELTPMRHWWSRLLDVTIKHGYKPFRAVIMLFVVYVVALGMAFWAQHTDGMMVPAQDPHYLLNIADEIRAKDNPSLPITEVQAMPDLPRAENCATRYPCFSPFGYAIDITVPIIQTGQVEAWRPNRQEAQGRLVRVVSWTCTALGWAFSTLAVAGYTGLVRRE
jgi:hypothetical protein